MKLDLGGPVTIAIFAKAPIAGFAKTRLIPRLGAEGAAKLQEELILRTVATALRAEIGPVHIWCAPDSGHPVFTDLARRHTIGLADQAFGTLGERMHEVFVMETAQASTLLIGVDCPPLTARHLRVCAERLLTRDAVFLPAEDGGYVLVGLRRPEQHVFENISWGGSTVMQTTRRRLREAKLTWSEPQVLWDLDLPTDLDRWEAFDNGVG